MQVLLENLTQKFDIKMKYIQFLYKITIMITFLKCVILTNTFCKAVIYSSKY